MKQVNTQQSSQYLIHRQTYIEILRDKITEKLQDEGLSFPAAATRVLLSSSEKQDELFDNRNVYELIFKRRTKLINMATSLNMIIVKQVKIRRKTHQIQV